MPSPKPAAPWTPPPIVWVPGAADPTAAKTSSPTVPEALAKLPAGTVFHAAGVPAFQPAHYTFMVSSFTISNTRSRDEDTDFISETLTVDGAAPLTVVGPNPPEKWNLDNGTFPQGARWAIGPVEITDPGKGVSFAYQITNSGNKDWETVNKRLVETGQQLAKAGASAATAELTAISGGLGPVLGPWLGEALGWIMGKITDLITVDCDGPVATALVSMKGQDLWAMTQNGGQATGTYTHPGVDSPAGCGSNSMYYTTWQILRS